VRERERERETARGLTVLVTKSSGGHDAQHLQKALHVHALHAGGHAQHRGLHRQRQRQRHGQRDRGTNTQLITTRSKERGRPTAPGCDEASTCSTASMTASRSSRGMCTAYSPTIHAVAVAMESRPLRLPPTDTIGLVSSGSWSHATTVHTGMRTE
jgi:hypothetical protein